jgi:nucleotide-binding universal stress UspA family protein
VKILVCTDFSAGAAAGEREAARLYPDAELVLFHAVDPRLAELVENLAKVGADALRKDMMQYADVRMSEVVDRLTSKGHRASVELVEGDPVDATLSAAARHHASLIVVGVAPGVPIGRFRTMLARRAEVPVLLVPDRAVSSPPRGSLSAG